MEIINTTDYDKDTVLRFQQFNARIVKSIPWSTHALFAFLMLSVLAGAFFAVRSHAWLYLAVLALALYVFGRRFYAIYIAPEKKFEQSSFAGLSQRYTFLKNSFIVCVNGKEDPGILQPAVRCLGNAGRFLSVRECTSGIHRIQSGL